VAAPIPESVPPVPAVAKESAAVVKPKPAKARTSSPVKPQPVATAAAKAEAGTGPARSEKTDRPYSAAELAENAYQEAARLRAQGDAAGAERRVRALLATDPKHVKARELLTGLQLENGRWLEAQDTLEQGMAQLPAHLAFRYQLARLHLERGEAARAVSLLEAARLPGQTDPELPAFLAALYQRSGRHAEAVTSYQEALAARPQEGRWWVGLGISLETQKDSDAARTAYRRALDTGRLTSNLARYAEDRLKALVTR
jgi:MSHA biogenesis protein MshN